MSKYCTVKAKNYINPTVGKGFTIQVAYSDGAKQPGANDIVKAIRDQYGDKATLNCADASKFEIIL